MLFSGLTTQNILLLFTSSDGKVQPNKLLSLPSLSRMLICIAERAGRNSEMMDNYILKCFPSQ